MREQKWFFQRWVQGDEYEFSRDGCRGVNMYFPEMDAGGWICIFQRWVQGDEYVFSRDGCRGVNMYFPEMDAEGWIWIFQKYINHVIFCITSLGTQLCLGKKFCKRVPAIQLLNQAENIPVDLPSFSVKIWGKSV